MLATIIPTLLNLVAFLLESLFVSSSSSSSRSTFGNNTSSNANDDSKHSHRDPSQLNDDERAEALREAADFFGLNSEESCDRDKVRRSYKKLSLRHHPDRNGNSQESAKMMAKVNYHYDLLESEIDRLEELKSSSTVDDDESTREKKKEEEEDEEESKSRQSTPPSANNKNKKSSKAQRKRARQKQNRARRSTERERAEMEREMKKEWEEMKKKRREVKASAKAMKKKSQQIATREGLYFDEGRDRANERWEDAVEEAEEGKVDLDLDQGSSRSTPTARAPDVGNLFDIDEDEDDKDPTTSQAKQSRTPEETAKKKKRQKAVRNPVMEVCTDDVVIYLRLGKHELAIDEMQEQLSEDIKKTIARCLIRENRMIDDSDIDQIMRQYLLLSIDDDDNSILHYAVYYGSADVIDFIYQFSRRSGSFWEVFLRKNRHRHIPLDYSKGRSSVIDQSVRDRLESLTEMARSEYEETLFLPSMKKAMHRFSKLLCEVHWAKVVNSLISYLFGTRIFQCRPIVSLLACAWVQVNRSASGKALAAALFTHHVALALLYPIITFLWSATDAIIPLMALSIPFGIMFCCSHGPKSAETKAGFLTLVTLPFWGVPYLVSAVSGALAATLPRMPSKVPSYVHHLEQSYYVVMLSMLAVGAKLVTAQG